MCFYSFNFTAMVLDILLFLFYFIHSFIYFIYLFIFYLFIFFYFLFFSLFTKDWFISLLHHISGLIVEKVLTL